MWPTSSSSMKMSDRPTPLTDEAIRAAGGQWTFLVRDLCRDLERQLTAATQEREQMGKQAHANACEAMEYRRQLTDARTALEDLALKWLERADEHDKDASEDCGTGSDVPYASAQKCREHARELEQALARIDERHPELAAKLRSMAQAMEKWERD